MSLQTRLWRMLGILGFAACFALGSAYGQTTVAAGKCRNVPTFATIQAAVNAVTPGGTVFVCPGTYPEQVTINKNLTMQGVSNGNADASVISPPTSGMIQNATDPSPASLNPSIAAQVFIQGAVTVTLASLIIDGSNNQLTCGGPTLVGIYDLNAAAVLKNLNVRNQALDAADASCNSGVGIFVEGNTGNAVTVKTTTLSGYQKNGIAANGFGDGSLGPAVTLTGNTVVGQGANAAVAQTGIQIGLGATGSANSNLVVDNSAATTSTASSAILIYASKSITASGNRISNSQFGIATASDGTYGAADSSNLNNDYITASQIAAIEVCSNSNLVEFNDLYSSGQASVKLDNSCTEGTAGGSSGNSNTVTNNDFNGDCAGVLQAPGATGNTISTNPVVANVFFYIQSGATCTSPLSSPPPSATALPVPFR